MRSFFVMLKKLTFILTLSPALVFGQLSGVKSNVKAIAAHKDLQQGHLGFYLYDLDSAAAIYTVNGLKSFIPASTLKVPTTAAALDVLGADYCFITKLGHTGELVDSTIKGNLIITGGGDPTLDSDRFMHPSFVSWVSDKLREKGVKKIEGSIIVDASRYDRNLPHNWIWGDVGNYYGAGSFGFNFMDNTYRVYLKSGGAGSQTRVVRVDPDLDLVNFDNAVVAAAISSDQAYIYPKGDQLYITGRIPQNRKEFRVRGSMTDPGKWFTTTLLARLKEQGITVIGENHLTSPTRVEVTSKLGAFKSPPLKTIVEMTNLISMNLYAECLAKEVAVKRGVSGPTTEAAAKSVVGYWSGKGIPIIGWKMNDGSGLSRNNGITPRQMNHVLRYMYKADARSEFLKSLPVAGERGTMRNMCKGTKAQGKVMAKSGYINGCRAYVGYVTGTSGKMYSFVLMANNYTCSNSEIKRKFTKVMVAMAGLP